MSWTTEEKDMLIHNLGRIADSLDRIDESMENSSSQLTQIGSDSETREPKPCSKRVVFGSGRYGFCLKPAGHDGECAGENSEYVKISNKPATCDFGPNCKPRWGR